MILGETGFFVTTKNPEGANCAQFLGLIASFGSLKLGISSALYLFDISLCAVPRGITIMGHGLEIISCFELKIRYIMAVCHQGSS